MWDGQSLSPIPYLVYLCHAISQNQVSIHWVTIGQNNCRRPSTTIFESSIMATKSMFWTPNRLFPLSFSSSFLSFFSFFPFFFFLLSFQFMFLCNLGLYFSLNIIVNRLQGYFLLWVNYRPLSSSTPLKGVLVWIVCQLSSPRTCSELDIKYDDDNDYGQQGGMEGGTLVQQILDTNLQKYPVRII